MNLERWRRWVPRIVTKNLVILLPIAMSLPAAEPPRAAEGSAAITPSASFVIRSVRVFDGERLVPPQDVSVEGGRIQAVGPNLTLPPGITEIKVSDATLLPGLIDSHTHDWGDSAKQALLFGVTTELNMGAPPEYVAALKRAEEAGEGSDSATVLSAGSVVTPPRGHGTQFGIPVPTLTGPAEASAFVDARLAEGSDYIKIILDDGKVCHQDFAALSEPELEAAIAVAHARGKLAVVHVTSQQAARAAITAGADGIAHLFADTPPQSDLVTLMRRQRAFAITTLGAAAGALGNPVGPSLLEDPRLSNFLSPAARSHLREPTPFRCEGSLSNALAAAKELHAAAVPILAGTDSPAPGSWNGASVHGEIALLVQGGLSPSDALASATSVPARVFGLQDRGRIAAGGRADLLLVHGDPTRDITATRDIVGVWKAGVRVQRITAVPGLTP
jgi:imidazolonepropionase-like amidohydrolase